MDDVLLTSQVAKLIERTPHKGRKAGKTKTDFFIEEYEALHPRVTGLFDDEVETLRRRRRSPKGTKSRDPGC
jgi:hypothetical protein